MDTDSDLDCGDPAPLSAARKTPIAQYLLSAEHAKVHQRDRSRSMLPTEYTEYTEEPNPRSVNHRWTQMNTDDCVRTQNSKLKTPNIWISCSEEIRAAVRFDHSGDCICVH